MDEETYDNAAVQPPLAPEQMDARITDMIRGMMGPPLEVPPARPPTIIGYPDDESDPGFAQRSGFGYGTPMAGLVQGDVRKYHGPSVEDMIGPQYRFSGDAQEKEDMLNNAKQRFYSEANSSSPQSSFVRGNSFLRDHLTKEALLMNRIPFATYGYSPQSVLYDARPNAVPGLGGFYLAPTDTTYIGRGQDTLAHESIHRAMQKLLGDREGSTILGGMIQRTPNYDWYGLNEDIVRYTIRQHAPDSHSGMLYDKSTKYMDDPVMQEMLRRLEAVAQKRIAERNPRGPR